MTGPKPRGFQHIDQLRGSFPYADNLPQSLTVEFKIPPVRSLAHCVQFINDAAMPLKKVGLEDAVVGVSGGVDSVTAALVAQEALGTNAVCKVVVDYGTSDAELPDIRKAREAAEALGGPTVVARIADVVSQFESATELVGSWATDLNLQTRLIQNAIFEVADRRGSWVVSTVDRSEHLLGRYTEFFYGHVEPLAALYKTEVIELGKLLGCPPDVLASRPGCETWMWDDELFGTTYEVIDPVLFLLVERRLTPREIADRHAISFEWVRGLADRVALQQARLSTARPGSSRFERLRPRDS